MKNKTRVPYSPEAPENKALPIASMSERLIVPRNKSAEIPFEANQYEQYPNPMDSYDSKKDDEKLIKFARDGNIEALKDLVNRKIFSKELHSETPGRSTRDLFAGALSRLVENENPELKTIYGEEKFKRIRDLTHPGLKEASQAVWDKSPQYKESNRGLTGFDSLSGTIEMLKSDPDFTDSAQHELGHKIDELARLYKSPSTNSNTKEILKKFFESNPKYNKVVDSLSINPDKEEGRDLDLVHSHLDAFLGKPEFHPRTIKGQSIQKTTTEGKKIPVHKYQIDPTTKKSLATKPTNLTTYESIDKSRTPNLEDYNYGTGEFDSDTIMSPIQKYEEVGGEHHYGERPFSYDNFINAAQKGIEGIVKNQDRFSNIRKKVS